MAHVDPGSSPRSSVYMRIPPCLMTCHLPLSSCYLAMISECFVENWTGCSIDGTCSSNGTMVSFVDALKFAVFGAAAATAAAALAGLQLF